MRLLSAFLINYRYLLRNAIYHADGYLKNNTLPPNDTTASLVQGLITAHQAYNISSSKSELSKCILFVVQQPERNIFDQRLLEYALQAKYITTFRLPFALTMKHTQISDNEERLLIYTPPHSPTIRYEVSVVYFRSTYTPTEFPYENDWEARYRIERSAAIKCPSILTQLAGSKKVQQVLATPSSSHIERFLNKQDSDRVRKSFAPIYPLDNSEAGQEAKSIAMDPNRSHGYVLKPQREGGGNNIYRKAIPPFLEALGNQEKWNGHILMELIDPPSQRNYIFCNGVTKSGEVIPELGIFGTCLWSQTGQIDHNENAGYVLRTKERESEEGGVAAGFGAVDSLCLVDV